jgi:quinol monooxygenase YgiN
MMADAPLYCLSVKLCIKSEVRSEFLDCIAANQHGTLSSEPLAVTYVYGEDEKEPNTFHFFEQYQGVEGFEAHTKTPHFAAWEEFASTEPFTEPPVVTFYTDDGWSRPGLAEGEIGRQSLFCLNVALHVKEERRTEFLAAMRVDQNGALSVEQACATYLFGEDAKEPNTFHMFEQYIGREGFAEHAKSPYYGAWSDFKATDPFSKPATVAYYNTIEPTPKATSQTVEEAVRPGTTSSGGGSGGGGGSTTTAVEPQSPPPNGFEWAGTF